MQSATPVSKRELVRLLVIEHGQKKASELSGEPYEKVRKWTQRGDWLSSQSVPTRGTVERIQDTLQAQKRESRTLLAEYQIKAATEAAAHAQPLSITRQVNDLASIHSKVWPEEQTTSNVFSLNVLNLTMLDGDDT